MNWIQRFLNYSINPGQYRLAIVINLLMPIGFIVHLTVIDGWGAVGVALVLGLLTYTFGEYAFHRWIAHGYMERYMDVHHDEPERMFTTPWFAAPLFLLVAWPGVAFVTSPALASGFFLGAALLHVYADLQHYLVHHTATRRFLRDHHLHHHHRTTVNFGLTTRLWDRLLGTLDTTKETRNDTHR